jgi:PPOX class probable F420-dependent enzyme
VNDSLRRLLDGPNYLHLTTLMKDGSPQAAAVWGRSEGERVVFFKEERSLAYRNLKRDPRVAISVIGAADPYEGAMLRGEAIEFRGNADAVRLQEEMSLLYTGKPYPPEQMAESEPGVLIVVELVRTAEFAFDFLRHDPPHV